MTQIISIPDTAKKLDILSTDGQYDLACACSSTKDEHRKRGSDGKWIYPVSLPNGGTSPIFKTLISNVCTSDCKYCPLRQNQDLRRCTLSIDETVTTFLDYYRRKKVFGLFLSSGVLGTPDATMDKLIGIAHILRNRHKFRGYIHLKIIPGSSSAAITQAVSLASAVSLNIETAGEKHLKKLSNKKDYIRDIIEPIKLISNLTAKGNRYSRVKQTTQFIVGAAGESDSEIVNYTAGLYNRLNMSRVYFSAYQKGLGDKSLPAENIQLPPAAVHTATAETFWASDTPSSDILTREHRLYQADFLLRKYGFNASDMIFGTDGNFDLTTDPKETWAKNHPELFPVNINQAEKFQLLRVPGLGPITVNRILKRRRQQHLRQIEDIGKPTKLLQKANQYITF